MSPKPKDTETTVAQAAGQERVYDWLGASESYKKALSLMGKHNFSALGEKHEQMGYATYRAAMQAKNQEEFKERMQEAVRAYEEAHRFYDQLEGKEKARTYRCEAISKYFGYWLSPSAAEKSRLLDECLDLE